jgi:uncharacterized metal-binding protein YceD (DUF177 family)
MMMDRSNEPTPEFSRPVDTTRLPREGASLDIAAAPAERAALAQRFGLLSLDRLEAQVALKRLAGDLIRVTAELSADVVQSCVVTLDPVASGVEDSFTLLYGAVEEASELVLDSEAETVEPLDRETIDIGEAVAQQLSLALDPFPRSPEAPPPDTVEAEAGSEPGEAPESPFGALANWGKSTKSI